MKPTITLYAISWNKYWHKYGHQWSGYVNAFNTVPDEIIVVSDEELDLSSISITNNVKNIVSQYLEGQSPRSYYRNLAVHEATSDWVVSYDLDDEALPNYLDNLNPDADIHGFTFIENNITYQPDENSLLSRLHGTPGLNLIPGTSAIKKNFFKNIKYENDCYEDKTFYSLASSLKPNLAFDQSIRFKYSGFNSYSEVFANTSQMYQDMILGKRNLFVCWFSDKMTESRKLAFDVLSNSCGVDLKLITSENFYDYENKQIPIHSGFQFLTDTDKSDYARAYLMYFYGGGYSDIKANNFDWNPYFDQLLFSRYDAIGYAEQAFQDIANFWDNDTNIKNIVENNYNKFAGNGHFIFKPRTKFAYDWIVEIHRIMDKNYKQLKSNPGVHPYMVRGGFHNCWDGVIPDSLINHGYPFDWTTIGGTTRHRLEYEHGFDIFKKGMPFPNMTNYR